MAILKGNIEFTGSMGSVTAYKRYDSDKIILRGKGGASRRKIYKSPSFQRTRENFSEFGLCAQMGGCIRRSLIAIAPLADHNFTPQLTAIGKIIQKLDTKNPRGERGVLLSQHKHLLVGFSWNKKIAFESIVKPALPHQIDRLQGSAIVQIPELLPGLNFSNPKSHPFYRFIINMGCVSDKWPGGFQPKGIDDGETVTMYSSWRPSFETAPAEDIQIQLTAPEALSDSITIMLSVGIQFGAALTDAIVQPAKRAGCAKIIAVA